MPWTLTQHSCWCVAFPSSRRQPRSSRRTAVARHRRTSTRPCGLCAPSCDASRMPLTSLSPAARRWSAWTTRLPTPWWWCRGRHLAAPRRPTMRPTRPPPSPRSQLRTAPAGGSPLIRRRRRTRGAAASPPPWSAHRPCNRRTRPSAPSVRRPRSPSIPTLANTARTHVEQPLRVKMPTTCLLKGGVTQVW
jgi:hypothetical protein